MSNDKQIGLPPLPAYHSLRGLFKGTSQSIFSIRNSPDFLLPIRHSHFSIRHSFCLVALNHERGEEEKRGLIRWLRPEYQAKGSRQAGTSPEAQQTAEQQELSAVTAKKNATTQKRPWPKTLPEQVRVLRQTLEAQSEPIDPSVLAKTFKGARKERVEMLLETLQALGHAHEVGEKRYTA